MSERLHTTVFGESGSPIAFCHGLFGQGKNFTALARQTARDHRVALIDMPDHGRSPWSERFSYIAMADRVADELQALVPGEPWSLVGHSMGAKVVMLIALRRPELVRRLCVVDMSPVTYSAGDAGAAGVTPFVAGMRALPLDELTDRSRAEELLAPDVPDPVVRSFLLQNLRRDGQGFRWQMNLDLLGDSLDALGAWPADELPADARYDGPTLWVAGSESGYVRPEFEDAMRGYFPRARLVTVKGAGHWVHSERPDVFAELIRRWAQD